MLETVVGSKWIPSWRLKLKKDDPIERSEVKIKIYNKRIPTTTNKGITIYPTETRPMGSDTNRDITVNSLTQH